jgi:hypothetical protein
MNVPGLFVFDVRKVKVRKLLHALKQFASNIIRRLKNLSEGWLHNDRRITFMIFEKDRASPQSSPHWRY